MQAIQAIQSQAPLAPASDGKVEELKAEIKVLELRAKEREDKLNDEVDGLQQENMILTSLVKPQKPKDE